MIMVLPLLLGWIWLLFNAKALAAILFFAALVYAAKL